MATLDTTSFKNALKILYPDGLEELWYPQAPFVAWIPKTYDFEGTSKAVRPIVNGVRGSTNFTVAVNAKSTPSIKDFLVTRAKDYVIASIDNEALLASRSQKGAVAKAIDVQMRAATYEFGRSLAFASYNNGGGARAQISTGSSVSTDTITLKNINDIVRFEIGMVLEASSTDGLTGSKRAGTVEIKAIDRGAGKLTATGNWNAGIAAIATSDYLFREGDFNNVLKGVLAWVPKTAPTSGESFFGVDRSVDPDRLAGIRLSGGGKVMEEVVFDAQAQAAINGANVDTLWMNTKRFAELCKSIHSKTTFYKESKVMSDKASIGFDGFVIPGAQGPVTVVADPNCPHPYGLLTNKDAWELAGLGRVPHFSEEDGLKFSREANADAIEFRLKMYGQIICHRPVNNVLIDWDG